MAGGARCAARAGRAPVPAGGEVRGRARRYLDGLLARVERKNGWQLAEQIGEAGPQGVQRLLNAARWDADAVRDDLRAYVVEQLGEPGGVLIVDETGFIKKGTQSVGVQRQYSGTAGRRENCQVGVFLSYASSKGRTFLDRELYLPKDWADDPARRREAGVPEAVTFATKPGLAVRMLGRAFAAGVPAAWVTGDEIYGDAPDVRHWLERDGRPYVFAVSCSHPVWHGGGQERADSLASCLPEECWGTCSCGAGSQGERLYEWACVQLPYETAPGMAQWLLARRKRSDPTELASFRAFGPEATPLDALVRVAGLRWAIAEGFADAKGGVGLDQYEVRRWTAWYRHVTLALLAHAYLEVTRRQMDAAGTTAGAGRVLVGASDRAVQTDHPLRLAHHVGACLHRGQQPVPGAIPLLAGEPIVAGLPRPIPLRDIPPRRAGPQPPQDAVDHPPVVPPLPARLPVPWQQRGQPRPGALRQFATSYHRCLPSLRRRSLA